MVNVGRFFFLFFFLSPSILKPPRGSKRKRTKSKTCSHKRSPTEFLFSRHLVAQDEISRHAAPSVLDRLFFYSTSWYRAEVPDTLLNRSPTDFFFCFTLHRCTEQKSTTHCSNGPHNYVARQTKPKTTVKLQRTLTRASRPTPLQGTRKNRCKQRK